MTDCTFIQTLRSFRIYGMAIFDWALTLLGGYILARILSSYFKSENFYRLFFNVTFGLVVLAIFLHKIFEVDTMLGYYLGLNEMPEVVKCL